MNRKQSFFTGEEVYDRMTQMLLKDFSNAQPSGNIVFSPFSILMLISLLVSSSDGRTREELEEFLNGKASDENALKMISFLQQIQREFTEDRTLYSANALLVGENYREYIRDSYVRLVKKAYDSQVLTSDNLLEDVNRWVNEKTHGMIPQVLEQVSPDLVAILMNAVSFDAQWERTYYDEDVVNEDFHNSDGSVSRVRMLMSKERGYIEDSNVVGFVKPYKDSGYSFMAIMPKQRGERSLTKVIGNLNITSLFQKRTADLVSTMLPEFECQYQLNMKAYLHEKGVHDVFSQEAAFTPMSEMPLLIEEILHKAKIEVDRKGTRAAAVTTAKMAFGAAPFIDLKVVQLNRPFIYAIIHNRTGLPVFVGIVRKLDDLPEGEDRMSREEKDQVCKPLYKKICYLISDVGKKKIHTDELSSKIYEKAITAYIQQDIRALRRILEKVKGMEDVFIRKEP